MTDQNDDDGFLVRLSDVGRAGHCHKGARAWFAKRNLPWMQFISPGVPAKMLLAQNDAMANDVVAAARKRLRN